MNDTDRLSTLFDRYLASTLTPAESAELTAWVDADPSRQALADRLVVARQRVSQGMPAVDVEAAMARTRQEIHTPARVPVVALDPVSVTRSKRPLMWHSASLSWTLAAAAVVILALAGIQYLGHFAARSTAPAQTFATTVGQRMNVRLADGTRVTLGPESHLRVASAYADGSRTVTLEGEGDFAVVHDVRHPFVVHVRSMVIQDVGTEFDIRAYADDPSIRVGVANGVVAVRAMTLGQVITPLNITQLIRGDLALIDADHLSVIHHADIGAITAWQQGRLVFDNTPMRDVVRDLRRALNLQIILSDTSLAARHVSGSFDDESVDQLLDDITDIIGGQYRRTGQTVVIRRRAAGAPRSDSHLPPPLNTAQVTRP